MNEGHCSFVTLELLRERLASGDEREAAEAWVRQHCVFTTHTPVMAGHDRFDPGLLLEQMETFRHQLGLSETDLLAYGRVNPSDSTEAFNMTVLGLKMSRKSNGVSAINGLVARRQWHHLYPDRPVNEVPIGHITNGVHLPPGPSPTPAPSWSSTWATGSKAASTSRSGRKWTIFRTPSCGSTGACCADGWWSLSTNTSNTSRCPRSRT